MQVFQKLGLIVLAIGYCTTPSVAEPSAPVIRVSLQQVGNPQFPTGFWMSKSDPHFGHRSDALFWLNSDRIATTFFKAYCCGSGRDSGVRYGVAVFDLTGKIVATHEWTSMPDAPFHVGGSVGTLWVKHKDRLDLLNPDFGVVGEIPLPEKSQLTWSKAGHGVAVQTGTEIVFYNISNLSDVVRESVPADAWAVDVYGSMVLLQSQRRPCYAAIVQANNEPAWNIRSGAESDALGTCVSGQGILSSGEILVSGRSRNARGILHRNGTIEPIVTKGWLLGVADSGRLAFEDFHPNALAQKLDMDFGGHKEINIYDPSRRATVFRVKIGGQAGAALSPDGHHLAVIDRHQLFIYTMP